MSVKRLDPRTGAERAARPLLAGFRDRAAFSPDGRRLVCLEGHNVHLFDADDPHAYDDVVFGNTLFKRLPSGKFEEVSDRAGLETFWPWGIATGDFDNDGSEDVFIPSGMGYPYSYWPSALMMNNGNETFTDRAAERGIEPPPGGEYQEHTIGGKRAARFMAG